MAWPGLTAATLLIVGVANVTAQFAASTFSKWPKYGGVPKGYIGTQGDHDGALSLRNIQIRELR